MNVRIGRRVAIKVLNDEAVQKHGVVDRFEREAQAATRIESDHVVHVFDLGVLDDGRPYIVMELLEGESLGQQLQSQGVFSQSRAVFYAVQALRGLGDAHAAGVTHRDIKPDNMVVLKTKHGDEILKIVDFGISKLQSGLQQVTNMTQTNTILGSPVYMSPEQCRGTRHMDHRSDLYSLGVVLFELLTGQLPHKGETFNELMFKIALEDTVNPATYNPDLHPGLCEIVLKALAREPSERYQSAGEFEQALLDWCMVTGIDTSSWGSRRSKLRMSETETITVKSSGNRASVPDPIELAATKQPTQSPPKGPALVRIEGDGDGSPGARSSGRMAIATQVSAESTSSGERVVQATGASQQSSSVIGPVPLPAKGPRPALLAAIGAGVIAVGAIVFFATRGDSSGKADDTTTTPSATAANTASAAPSSTAAVSATTDPTAASTGATAPSASEVASAQPEASEPDGSTATSAKPPQAVPVATRRHTSATTASSVSVAAPSPPSATASAAPPPAGSAKPVVDGRRFRTDF